MIILRKHIRSDGKTVTLTRHTYDNGSLGYKTNENEYSVTVYDADGLPGTSIHYGVMYGQAVADFEKSCREDQKV